MLHRRGPFPEPLTEPPSVRADNAIICTCCGDQLGSDPFTTLCKHVYCSDCLANYVDCALHLGEKFSPHCCRIPITLELSRGHIPPYLTKRFEEKQIEITAATSLLCTEPGCRVIICEDNFVEGLGQYLACRYYTCASRNFERHKGRVCPTDKESELVLRSAKEQG